VGEELRADQAHSCSWKIDRRELRVLEAVGTLAAAAHRAQSQHTTLRDPDGTAAGHNEEPRDTFLAGWDDMAAVYIADTRLPAYPEEAVAAAVVGPQHTQTASHQDSLSVYKADS